ncbi:MAG: hypothetical protein HYZ00_09730 [Candidatus Hydrogenedentes bacterium]|nr:hypothetical protein [Candidatus Hydrogenedentota bacterium]
MTTPPAMIRRTLKMTFWMAYDHLGTLAVLNVLCMLFIAPAAAMAGSALLSPDPARRVFVGLPLLLLTGGVFLPLGAVGLAEMLRGCLTSHEARWACFWRGIRQFGLRAIMAGALLTAAACCLAVAAWFYPRHLAPNWALAGYVLGALALWMLLLLMPVSLLVWPALVQKRQPVLSTLKLCVLLVLANPLYFAAFTASAVTGVLAALLPPLWLLFSLAPLLVLATSAYEVLARRYATAVPSEDNTEDDYLNRGLRDLLFPWKG